jgi:hypothetical protein
MGCVVMSGFAVFIQYLNSMSSLSSSDYTQPSPPMAAPAIDLLTLSDRHHPTKPLQRQHAEGPKQPLRMPGGEQPGTACGASRMGDSWRVR